MCVNINILSKKEKGLSILESILKSRGITDTGEFFKPETKSFSDPFLFSDMKKAVDIIKNAVSSSNKILVWGDFDADGVTSTSILCKTLDVLNADYFYFLPDRATLGHGLNLKELLTLKSKNNIKVLITVDCGISNLREISVLKSLGVQTIITDHHEPPQTLPDADCILNPLAADSLLPDLPISLIEKNSYLSGAGVAMKLAFALLGEGHEDIKKQIVALGAIGTISDVVPLLGENRIIAARGLVEINNKAHFGVSKLFEAQNISKPVTSEDIAFILTPRINAAGRLSTPNESIKLLIDDNPITINMTIKRLDMLNKIRQGLCDKISAEALSMLKRPDDCIVLYNENWHLGIIGIVASRLADKFNLPVFLITKGEGGTYRCSARGTAGHDISLILKSLESYFLGYGGHAGAGGFSADSESVSIEELTEKIRESVVNNRDENKISNSINVDIELSGEDINRSLIDEINKMEPFGANNEKPKFLFKNAVLTSKKQIGKELNHLSYSVLKDKHEFNCIWWKRKILGINEGETIDFVFTPEINTYNGEEKLQLITECILNDKLHDSRIRSVKIFDHRQKTGIMDKINDYVKNKNGEVKIWATSINTKKSLEKYTHIKENTISTFKDKEYTLMLFDCPPDIETFREIIKNTAPINLHIMNFTYSKNPDDYILNMCGMIKYASNRKNGEIDINVLVQNTGLNEAAVHAALELLDKIGSIRIEDVDRLFFIKAPRFDIIRGEELYKVFSDELVKVNGFKDYIKTADIESIREICKV